MKYTTQTTDDAIYAVDVCSQTVVSEITRRFLSVTTATSLPHVYNTANRNVVMSD